MCGLTGIYSVKRELQEDRFRDLTDLLTHRGPDDGKYWISGDRRFALGFRRLAIMDSSELASQPISNESGNLHLVCNGEIYNHAALKKQLLLSGHSFKSTSDTEVILHAYEEWGIEAFKKLNGMFAVAIVDEENGKVIIARDRFGIKPLYYQINTSGFMCSSELRPILRRNSSEIDPDSIVNFLIYRYIPSPKTIYKDIFKLSPASVMVIDQNLHTETVVYWSVPMDEKDATESNYFEAFSSLLKNSVISHLQGSCPIGAFLSGGYDSSYIAMQMKKSGYDPETFSIGFEDWEKSEDKYALEVANYLHLRNKSEIIPRSLFLNDDIISAWDEPIADISIIPTYYLNRLAAQNHKAALSGDGADEILGGYNWYYDVAQQINNQKKSIFIKPRHHRIALQTYCNYSAMGLFDKDLLKKNLMPEYHHAIPDDIFWLFRKFFDTKVPVIKSLQLLDLKTFLPELILPKMDRASMAHSLEVRPPFLDHQIAELVFTHKTSLYFDPAQYKKLLFRALKGEIPDHILLRKKQGFTGPDQYYDQYPFYKDLFLKSALIDAGILSRKGIEDLFERKQTWHLWKLATLELWFSKFVK